MKYSLIRPFWLEVVWEAMRLNLARNLGRACSSQIRSRDLKAVVWLIVRFLCGISRCIMSGKNPSKVENLRGEKVVFNVRLRVSLFSSIARASPAMVTSRAAVFRVIGMVI